MPALPLAMGNQCVGLRRLEICALPEVLSPGADYLEPAILSPLALDHYPVEFGGDPVSLCRVPVQLRKLPRM
jgi:hypothetical protein